MTYYHSRKEQAQTEADQLALSDDRILYTKVEFEPDNGFVIVAVPKPMDITDLGDRCEIRSEGKRLTARPVGHLRVAAARKSAPPKNSGRKPKEIVREAAEGEILVRPPWESPLSAAPVVSSTSEIRKPWEV